MSNTLERTEFLGHGDGRHYKICLEDERILVFRNGSGKWEKVPWQKVSVEAGKMIDRLLDNFEDGYNRLVESEGVWYEYSTYLDRTIAVARKAYDISG